MPKPSSSHEVYFWYIDDLGINLKLARKLGMVTIKVLSWVLAYKKGREGLALLYLWFPRQPVIGFPVKMSKDKDFIFTGIMLKNDAVWEFCNEAPPRTSTQHLVRRWVCSDTQDSPKYFISKASP